MIWTYIVSIILALIWFLFFHYLAVKETNKSDYEFVVIERWIIILSIVCFLIPIVNIIFFIAFPIAYLHRLVEDNYDGTLMARENDVFSQTIKQCISWLKEGAF